jgi:hypothetical protein
LILSTIHSAKGQEWRAIFVLKDNLHLFASPLGPSPVSPRCSLAWSRTIAWLAAGDAQQPVAGDTTAAARCGSLAVAAKNSGDEFQFRREPMPPFGLDDEALSQLRTATAPLPAECRAEFIQAVAAALAGAEPGPGVLYRTIAPLQRLYLSGDRPRYPHRRWGRGPKSDAEPMSGE